MTSIRDENQAELDSVRQENQDKLDSIQQEYQAELEHTKESKSSPVLLTISGLAIGFGGGYYVKKRTAEK